MAENIVDSLFGPSPWQVQQARQAEQQKYAAQLAGMNNIQQAKFGIAQGAGQLAQAGAGMMGYVDPAVEQSQRREAVMASGGDLSTSAGLKAKAAQFAAAGDQQTAMKLVLAARAQEAKEQQMAVELRKQELAEKKQGFQEKEAFDLKKMQAEASIRQADERAADARLSAAERVAAQREATAARLELGKMMVAMKQSAADSKVKPDLPPVGLKLQQEELEAIGTTAIINKDLNKYLGQLEDKTIDLGFVKNLVARGKNLMGSSDPQSVAFANFKADMEKLRNDSLRLNKGTQTEGDAIRAWNELFENITDQNVVKARLKTIAEKNALAAEYRKKNVNTIRKNYKADPFDFSEYDLPAAAPEEKPAAASKTAPAGVDPKVWAVMTPQEKALWQ